jgi:hypothetical protein
VPGEFVPQVNYRWSRPDDDIPWPGTWRFLGEVTLGIFALAFGNLPNGAAD